MRAATRSITIFQPPKVVFQFVGNPENLPLWSQSICQSISKTEDGWTIISPDQHKIHMKWYTDELTGVVDQYLYPTPDILVYIPGRVVPNDQHSEFILTLFQPEQISELDYQSEVRTIEYELNLLKGLLEKP